MDNTQSSIQEKRFKNYILVVLYIFTGLYLLDLIISYSNNANVFIRNPLFFLFFLTIISIIVTYVIPSVYIRRLVGSFLLLSLSCYAFLAIYLFGNGKTDSLIWFIILPLPIYAVFPDIKITRLLVITGSLIPLVCAGGFGLRYFYYDNAPVFLSSTPLINIVLYHVLNAIAVFLLVGYSLIYIDRSNKLEIKKLKNIVNLQDEEKTQNLLELSYNEQYKYGKIYERITEYLESKRGYLNSDFKIGKISNDLNINTLYISRAIFLQQDMNFVHFINSYRIAHAKNMIRNNSQYTLEYIYLSSGFKNQSSFIRAFKLLEGTTPSEWREKNKEDPERK